MKIFFRTDASLEIGSGHVMRCLTLAEALKTNGAECHFICRDHDGHLILHIQSQGFTVHVLKGELSLPTARADLFHAHWLGTSQENDAQQSSVILRNHEIAWLIVDHYALDSRWESFVRPYVDQIMVIDDLADRTHDCDLLLDQTFGRDEQDYKELAPQSCRFLCGTKYSLLRPEFLKLRDYSLSRRFQHQFALKRLLINLGGVDKDNITSQILEMMKSFTFIDEFEITVVLGASCPWKNEVEAIAQDLPGKSSVLVNVKNIASIMAESDLAIGAAGATAWERCCLGLPSIMLVIANNQHLVAQSLSAVGAAVVIDDLSKVRLRLGRILFSFREDKDKLRLMSCRSSELVDGSGVQRVISAIS